MKNKYIVGMICPKCGKETVKNFGKKIKVDGQKEQRYLCCSCRFITRVYAKGLLCPECGSETLQKCGFVVVNREQRQRYICYSCKRITHKPIGKEVKSGG